MDGHSSYQDPHDADPDVLAVVSSNAGDADDAAQERSCARECQHFGSWT